MSSAQVVSTQEKGTVWRDTFMVPVACFLLFNIGDYVGRFLAGLIQWPKPSKAGSFIVLGFSIARFPGAKNLHGFQRLALRDLLLNIIQYNLIIFFFQQFN